MDNSGACTLDKDVREDAVMMVCGTEKCAFIYQRRARGERGGCNERCNEMLENGDIYYRKHSYKKKVSSSGEAESCRHVCTAIVRIKSALRMR